MRNSDAPSNALPKSSPLAETIRVGRVEEEGEEVLIPVTLRGRKSAPGGAPLRGTSARQMAARPLCRMPGRFAILALLGITQAIPACSSPPRKTQNLCAIFSEKHSWYRATQRSQKRWKISQAIQMALIFQESSFHSQARPPRTRLLWVIPWRRPSSAYGYAQVVRPTWESYLRASHRQSANRDNFWDASDFVGWYLDKLVRATGIHRNDARSLYLAYHEGGGGFRRGSHLEKDWLMRVAMRVQRRSNRYQEQLNLCREALEHQRWWWPF